MHIDSSDFYDATTEYLFQGNRRDFDPFNSAQVSWSGRHIKKIYCNPFHLTRSFSTVFVSDHKTIAKKSVFERAGKAIVKVGKACNKARKKVNDVVKIPIKKQLESEVTKKILNVQKEIAKKVLDNKVTEIQKKAAKEIAKAQKKATEKTGKWVEEHPVVTAAIVATAVVVATGGAAAIAAACSGAGETITAALSTGVGKAATGGIVTGIGAALAKAQDKPESDSDNKETDKPKFSSSTPASPSPLQNTPTAPINNPVLLFSQSVNPTPPYIPSTNPQISSSSNSLPQDPFTKPVSSHHLYESPSPISSSPSSHPAALVPPSSLVTEYKTYSPPASPISVVPPKYSTSSQTLHPTAPPVLPVPDYPLQPFTASLLNFQSPYPTHLNPATNTSIPHPYFPVAFPTPRISDPIPQTVEARSVHIRTSKIEHPLDFSFGMAKGLLKGGYIGIKEFGPGLVDTVAVLSRATWNLVTEPVDTILSFNQNVVDCIDYIKTHSTKETLGAVIPEFRELLDTWDNIDDAQRGKKAGVIISKYGVDILICNEAVRGIKAFQQLQKANRLLQFTTKALQTGDQAHLNQVGAILAKGSVPLAERQALLEKTILSNESLKKEFAEFVENSKVTVKPNGIFPPPGKLSSELNVANIRELITAGRETPILAKELGFAKQDIVHLTQTGTLDKTVASAFEKIVRDKAMLESLEKFRKAELFLKPYRGQYLSEIQARELIHQTGIKTFPRPKGIPDNFTIKISNKNIGIKYVHPENEGTYMSHAGEAP